MKTIFLVGFLDSFTTVVYHKKESTIHSCYKWGKMSRFLGWAPDLRSVQERIITLFPSFQKVYVIETKISKKSKS